MQTKIVQNPDLYEYKRASIDSQGVFTCYGATFGNVDSDGDIIVSGAFREALEIHKADGTSPALLWSHDRMEPIGKWIKLIEDDYGLLLTGKISDTQRGLDARALIKDHAISFSIGFLVARDGAKIINGIRHIYKIARLSEISIVAIPANSRARLVSAKAQAQQKRKFEGLLREAGSLSRKEAKRALAGIWGNLGCDDEDPEKLIRILGAINILTEATR